MSDERPPDQTYRIRLGRGSVLAGPHPAYPDESMLEPRLRALLQVGVTTFVDLTEDEEWVDYAPALDRLAAEEGVDRPEYIRCEMREAEAPQEPRALKVILDKARDDAANGRTTYVHCRTGEGRAGTVIGCLLRECGVPGEEALKQVADLRSDAGLGSGCAEGQRVFVRDWVVDDG